LLTRIDHVGIACRDLSSAIGFYTSVFGLTVASREVIEDQGVAEAMLHVADAPAGASYVQLLEPLHADTPVGRFLARRGEGIHHIGYGVSDISAALAALGATGIRLIDARPRHGSLGASIAFLHPGDVGGVLTELVQAGPRQRGRQDLTATAGELAAFAAPGEYAARHRANRIACCPGDGGAAARSGPGQTEASGARPVA
jgi:methylmalonyl-CoA/ethylmalonyl-CoA epimerase